MRREVFSRSQEDTRALGQLLGREVAAGDLIGLRGPLGAGKTCFVRGVAQGLRIPPGRVRSPSFTLINTYKGGRLPLYHVDLYRMEPTADDRMALREYLYGDGVCVVEWFEHFGEECEHLAVELAYAAGTNERRIRVESGGSRYDRLVEAVGDQSPWR